MRLNEDLIRSRCQEIEDSVQRLKEFGELDESDFLSDQDRLDIACYRLLVAIEAALAICFHVSAKKLRKVPEGYAECFKVMGEAQIIDMGLAERLQHMARFRNLLIHMYWKIDYVRVYRVLKQNLTDLRSFCASAIQLL